MNAAETITSPANPRIKQAAALRDADSRRTTGLTLVDGRRELARAAAAGMEIVEVFADTGRLHDPATVEFGTTLADWIATLAVKGTRIAAVSEKAFERVAFGGRNEGVVGVVRFGSRPLAAVSMAADRPVFVIEGVEKPGNLGDPPHGRRRRLGGVIVCDARTDVANPAVIRASLGTVFSMPLATASAAEAIDWCRREGRRVVAATPEGTRLWHEADLRARRRSCSAARPTGSPIRGRRRRRAAQSTWRACGCRCTGSPTASTSR